MFTQSLFFPSPQKEDEPLLQAAQAGEVPYPGATCAWEKQPRNLINTVNFKFFPVL